METKNKKYMKIILLMIVFIGLSVIIPSKSYAKYLTYNTSNNIWTTQTDESIYGMTDLALSFWNRPASITSIDQDSLYKMLNAKISLYENTFHFANKTGISSSDLWNIDVPTAMCWNHYEGDSASTYKVWQIICQELDTDKTSTTYGEFVTYNYYLNASRRNEDTKKKAL